MKSKCFYSIVAAFISFVATPNAQAQTAQQPPCFSALTQDCLLAEAAARARVLRGAGILGSLAIANLANVARAYAKLGRKEQADRAFAEADALANKEQADRAFTDATALVKTPIGPIGSIAVVRALFAAGRVDEAMLRTKTVKGPAVAQAAIDALIAAGQLTEAESFLPSSQYKDTDRRKLAEAYLAAGQTDKVLSLITAITEPYRTAVLRSAAYAAEKAGRAEVVAALLASLPDDAARQTVRQTMLEYSSGALSATALSSALEKGDFDEAMKIIARPEMASTRASALSSAVAAACKAGKKDLARKLDDDAGAALATMKANSLFLPVMVRRAVIEAQCKEDQLATASFGEARTYIDGQPKHMHPYLDGMLVQGYLTAGNIQAAIETTRRTNDSSTVSKLDSGMAKAGHVREAYEYIETDNKVDLPDMLVVLAENVPSHP